MIDLKNKSEFIMEIINGNYTLDEAKNEVKEYEKRYGSDFFADYEVERKPKPWNREYLEELSLRSMSGMASKQLILHLAEVSEYIHKNEKQKKIKKIIIITGAICGIIAALVILAIAFSKANAS